jgi:hypothetical protein
MEPTSLRREVLPPRQAPTGACGACDFASADKQLRAAISRSISTLLIAGGLTALAVRLVEILL